MKQIWFIVFSFLFLVLFGSASYADSRGETILRQMREAQKRLESVGLSVETKTETRVHKKKVKSKKTGKWIWVSYKRTMEFISAKEIALAAWDPIENKHHTIRLLTPYLYGNGFSFQVLTDGYEVEHISGRGPSKLVFEARKDGKKLLVLAGKHWWMPPGYSKNDDPKVFEKYAEEIIYSPYAPDLYDEENTLVGADFLFKEIASAKRELKSSEAVSKAFPNKYLYEVIPDDYLFNLAHNEQMDHGKFGADANLTAEEISIEYAQNLENSFRWIASRANARGAFQFTNIGRGRALGTYDYVVRECPKADLIKDFNAGTQNLRNMIKAAACLLDAELANFPKDVLDLYEKDYRAASVYPSACYNGGCKKGFKLYKWIRANKKELQADSFEFPVSAVGHPETHMYLVKQAFLWSYIDGIKEKLKNYKGRP